jgi:hypothetical protein
MGTVLMYVSEVAVIIAALPAVAAGLAWLGKLTGKARMRGVTGPGSEPGRPRSGRGGSHRRRRG